MENHYYSREFSAPRGFSKDGDPVGYCYAYPTINAKPLYHFANDEKYLHFYTLKENPVELDNLGILGYSEKGISCYVPIAEGSGVHRYWCQETGDNALSLLLDDGQYTTRGYIDTGVIFLIFEQNNRQNLVPLYRFVANDSSNGNPGIGFPQLIH